jgi:hypothetical protein
VIRVKGLVRAASLVRQQLQAGIRPDEAQQFREQVASILRTVETICSQNGMTPELLPAQSRQAYWYLKELDTEHLSLPPAQDPFPVATSLHIKNIVKTGDYVADLLWQQSDSRPNSATTYRRFKRDLQRQVDDIEKICTQQKSTPAALATPSRRVYCWLKFLLSENNLAHHLAALAQARAMVDRSQPPLDRPLHLYLINLDSLWRMNAYNNRLLLKVNEGFLTADQEVWEALIRTTLYQCDPARDQQVRDFGDSEEFNEVLFEMDSFAESASSTAQGQFHNLEESFYRVNAAYFHGSMPKPNLVWSRLPTVQTFGHYQPSRDVVMLSLSLDQSAVPSLLMDYVMYHELLHKKHGTAVVNGRRLVHTPAFRQDELNFSGYEAAKCQLNDLALTLRGRRQKQNVKSGPRSRPTRRPRRANSI